MRYPGKQIMSSIADIGAGKRVLLGCLSVVVSCVVVALYVERTKPAFDRKTFSILRVGMPEQDVFDLLGKPGWHVGFGRTSLAMGRIRPYFDPSGVREHGEGQMTKGWADNHGIIVVTFKESRVLTMFYEPIVRDPTLPEFVFWFV